jgi:hypothetical protein
MRSVMMGTLTMEMVVIVPAMLNPVGHAFQLKSSRVRFFPVQYFVSLFAVMD